MTRTLLVAAIEGIDELMNDPPDDADAALDEVGRFIGAAMTARDAEADAVANSLAATADDKLPDDIDADLMGEFITECREYIEASESALLTLESDPDDMEAINTVFRAFHTMKGTSGFLGLNRIQELAHKAENLFSRVRDKEIRCSGGYADLALRSADMLKELIQIVQDALGGQADGLR